MSSIRSLRLEAACGCLLLLSSCGWRIHAPPVKVELSGQAISASSQHPSFGPALLVDRGLLAENAWHSAERPSYPQWIQIQLPQPARLRRFGLQAQVNSPQTRTNNVDRAPRKLRLWASEDPNFKVYEDLGSFNLTYKSSGDWCMRRITTPANVHSYYRFIILENGGDSDFVTIQEMNFYCDE